MKWPARNAKNKQTNKRTKTKRNIFLLFAPSIVLSSAVLRFHKNETKQNERRSRAKRNPNNGDDNERTRQKRKRGRKERKTDRQTDRRKGRKEKSHGNVECQKSTQPTGDEQPQRQHRTRLSSRPRFVLYPPNSQSSKGNYRVFFISCVSSLPSLPSLATGVFHLSTEFTEFCDVEIVVTL